jgi:hypothetical protein
MTYLYHPSFACPIQAVNQTMITQRILQGASPAETHIIYIYTISFIPDQLPHRQEKKTSYERNVPSAKKLREDLSETHVPALPQRPTTSYHVYTRFTIATVKIVIPLPRFVLDECRMPWPEYLTHLLLKAGAFPCLHLSGLSHPVNPGAATAGTGKQCEQ